MITTIKHLCEQIRQRSCSLCDEFNQFLHSYFLKDNIARFKKLAIKVRLKVSFLFRRI